MTITNYANTGHRLYCANQSTETSYNDYCFYHASEKGVTINSATIAGNPANSIELELTLSDLNFAEDIFTDYEVSFRGVKANLLDGITATNKAMQFPDGIPVAISDD